MARTNGEESKLRIFKSAEELFARKGIKATKVSEIVKNAGLSQAAFYIYFNSKDDILKQMVQQFEQQLLTLTVEVGNNIWEIQSPDVASSVSQYYTQIFEILGANANLMKISLQFADEKEEIRSTIVKQITENIKQSQSLGIIKNNLDVPIAAEMIVVTIERLVYRFMLTEERTPKQLSEQMTNMLLNGILAETSKV
ncbi:TetR/AcrR family transcriptional regulator [Bacillus sp. JJ722]|uniref:TetR/AcrR family transcriptional regulator n=1 Tax=Bacillus sp. JJ722 TaxID=3122973 RepID=UPI003000E6CD